MDRSFSRRRVVTWGAAGAALPLIGGVGTAAAAQPDHPGVPGYPGRVFDVRDFGARGDGVTIDTDAINRAIATAAAPPREAAAGGTVYFPAGTYASYSIHLSQQRRRCTSAQNATLLAAAPTAARGYDPAEPGAGNTYQDFGHSHWHNSLIWGENLDRHRDPRRRARSTARAWSPAAARSPRPCRATRSSR